MAVTRGSPGKSWKTGIPDGAALRELKLEALLEVAARTFHEHGFRGTSLGDIATKLGVSKPTLYHYVSNKQDLLYRLHNISLGYAEEIQAQVNSVPRTGLEKIHFAIGEYLKVLLSSPTACLVLLEDGALTPEQTEEILARRRKLEYALRQMVRDGIRDGSITPSNPKMVAFVILGAINWLSRWYRPDGKWHSTDVAEAVILQLLRGIAAKPEDVVLPLLGPDGGREERETQTG